jgi:membrane-associated phospholipid phosphatase
MTARPAPPERQGRDSSGATSTDSAISGKRDHLLADWWVVVLLSAATTAVFARVGALVSRHGSTALDRAARGWVISHQSPGAVSLFSIITTVGGTRWMYSLAAIGAAFFWYHGHRRVAVRCIAAPVAAVALYEIAKRLYARARPPGIGALTEGSFAFPSAHATASATVCGTLAYILWREGFIRGRVAIAIVVVPPLLIGFSRVYLDRHWATDVLGGWSAGFLIAAFSVALYKRGRRRRIAREQRASPSP